VLFASMATSTNLVWIEGEVILDSRDVQVLELIT
jgi:hypothetical protein